MESQPLLVAWKKDSGSAAFLFSRDDSRRRSSSSATTSAVRIGCTLVGTALLAAWLILRFMLAPVLCRTGTLSGGGARTHFVLALSLLTRSCSAASSGAANPPNLLMLVIDDLGFADVHFMGSPDAADMGEATPHLTSMAERGVILRSFYVSPTCTPTRAALLTGMLPIYLGLQDSVIHATEPRGLNCTYATLAEKLQDAGYQTFGIGNWHLGFHQPQYQPTRRGFSSFFGILTGGGGHFSHKSTGSFTMRGADYKSLTVKYIGFNLWHDGEYVSDDDDRVSGKHTTEAYTDFAIEQLQTLDTSLPFFMYLSFQAVHSPIEVPARYTDGSVANGCSSIVSASSRSMRQGLCGMINQLDDGASAVEGVLRDRGLWEKTVVVFLSDNGGITAHGSLNLPYRGEKGTYFEGGIRAPAFLGGGYTELALAAGGWLPYESSSIVHVTDLHAMSLGLAGVAFKTSITDGGAADETSIQGIDQWSFLVESGGQGTPPPRTEILHNMNSATFGNAGALRMGDYKLIVEAKVTESEVYTYGQHILQDADFDAADLAAIISKKLLKNEGTFSIFNIAKNPTETDDGECEDAEACSNIFEMDAFSSTRIALLDRWKAYRDSMGRSALVWEDDGPLTNPDLFGGFWTSWRDEAGQPYALYELAADPTGHFDESGSQVKPASGVNHDPTDGEAGSGGGVNTWKSKPSPGNGGGSSDDANPAEKKVSFLMSSTPVAGCESGAVAPGVLSKAQPLAQSVMTSGLLGALVGSLLTIMTFVATGHWRALRDVKGSFQFS